MSKLALAVILFVILIKTAFGASLQEVTQNVALNSQIIAVLSRAKATADVKQTEVEAWQKSVAAYCAELKKELAITEKIVDTKFIITESYINSLDPLSPESENFLAAATSFSGLISLQTASEEEIMLTVIKMVKLFRAVKENPDGAMEMLLTLSQEDESFNAEHAFSDAKTKADYISVLKKLKEFNAQAVKDQKGGPAEFIKFNSRFTKIFN